MRLQDDAKLRAALRELADLFERQRGPGLGPLIQIPCLLTLAGGLAGVGGAALLADGQVVAAALLLVVGQLLDILDGAAARRLGLCSRLGATMDLFVDLALTHVLLVVWGLVWLVPIVATLQAAAHVHTIRVSGRSAIVVLTIAAVFWDMVLGP